MRREPSTKRAAVFIDGQNLFFAVRDAFGFTFPNYDVQKLARALCKSRGWQCSRTRFYTGIPERSDDPTWHDFWTAKLAFMGKQGVGVYSRPLRYRNKRFRLPGGTLHSVLVREEKGIDVRIAIDVIRNAYRNDFDVALILSQDQDLSEVATVIRTVAAEQGRWIKVASAFQLSPTTRNRRGINGSDWIPIERDLYEGCIDPREYRPQT